MAEDCIYLRVLYPPHREKFVANWFGLKTLWWNGLALFCDTSLSSSDLSRGTERCGRGDTSYVGTTNAHLDGKDGQEGTLDFGCWRDKGMEQEKDFF